MSNELNLKTDTGHPLIYQIRFKSHLDSNWTDWFEGLTVTLEANGDTLLTGPVVDQAALHGLLKKVRDLGVTLVSVNQILVNETHPENGIRDDQSQKIDDAAIDGASPDPVNPHML